MGTPPATALAVGLIYMVGFIGLGAQCKMVVGPTTAWRLVFLEGGVASEASYPAWPVTETSRPKVLVFFTFVVDVVGYKG